MTTDNFNILNISQPMVLNLQKIGFLQMTPIQKLALPHILNNKDIIAKAKTGSGKTATFGIALLDKLNVKKFRVQSLILCPTRELADQVAKELREIAKFTHNIKILTLCGGVAFYPQANSLSHHAHIVVGTPGRVLKHLNKGSLSLEDLTSLVLDEADRMLDMGFIEEIQNVISFAPLKRQTLLFSATYPDEIKELCNSVLDNPVEVQTQDIEQKNDIKELFFKDLNKKELLIRVFATYNPQNAIVFCNTKIECSDVADFLQENGIDALALHGDMEQYDRDDTLVQFTNGSCRVVVATDVAARGLDIKDLAMVVNYDKAQSTEIYTHRIGRTGRAGAQGIAVSFVDDCINCEDEKKLQNGKNFSMKSMFFTLVIEGGKKDKLRKGDILGALGGECGVDGKNIGKIDINNKQSFIALDSKLFDFADKNLKRVTIKKRNFSSWIL